MSEWRSVLISSRTNRDSKERRLSPLHGRHHDHTWSHQIFDCNFRAPLSDMSILYHRIWQDLHYYFPSKDFTLKEYGLLRKIPKDLLLVRVEINNLQQFLQVCQLLASCLGWLFGPPAQQSWSCRMDAIPPPCSILLVLNHLVKDSCWLWVEPQLMSVHSMSTIETCLAPDPPHWNFEES